jgi:phosphate-selective porin OprO/OprP
MAAASRLALDLRPVARTAGSFQTRALRIAIYGDRDLSRAATTIGRLVFVLLAMFVATAASAQDPASDAQVPSPDLDKEDGPGGLSRSGKGVTYSSFGGPSEIHLWLRTQFRYSDPFDSDPVQPEDFDDLPGGDLDVRRARLKAEGKILNPKVGFYFERELAGEPRQLDLRLDLTLRENLRVRIGQYKVLYNRERVDSSGKQQFAERSIVTRPFTLDRQRGVTVAGRFGAGRALDSWYFVGWMEGDGRDPHATGGKGDGDMWLGRYQWNFVGEPLPFSQGDPGLRSMPAGTLAFAAAKYEGPYTRFSSSGGGQLDGFEEGSGDRYVVEQWMQEFAWHYDGWSVQQEFHVKHVDDRVDGGRTRLTGYYAQGGKAWPWTIGTWTRPVEVAARLAKVVTDDAGAASTSQREATLALNLYLAGHDNKLTLDVSKLRLSRDQRSDWRWRLQWDVSF